MFQSSDATESSTATILGFVDDSTGCVNTPPNQPMNLHELQDRMQADPQLWHDLLWYSGGRLEPRKCSYHILHYVFAANGAPYPMTKFDRDIEVWSVKVRSVTGDLIPIPQLTPYQPHKTLGHYKAPAGDSLKQVQVIEKQSRDLSHALYHSPATRDQAIQFYTTIFLPAIGQERRLGRRILCTSF